MFISASVAATALYDMKHEQLQSTNVGLQQQGIDEHSHAATSTEKKQQEISASTTTDQSTAATTEAQQFAEGGIITVHKKNFSLISNFIEMFL